jgi:hypothetical protein
MKLSNLPVKLVLWLSKRIKKNVMQAWAGELAIQTLPHKPMPNKNRHKRDMHE